MDNYGTTVKYSLAAGGQLRYDCRIQFGSRWTTTTVKYSLAAGQKVDRYDSKIQDSTSEIEDKWRISQIYSDVFRLVVLCLTSIQVQGQVCWKVYKRITRIMNKKNLFRKVQSMFRLVIEDKDENFDLHTQKLFYSKFAGNMQLWE